MDNFLGGFHAVILGLMNTIAQVMDFPLFWGFATGFVTSTVVHAFLLSDHPRDVPTVLFQEKAKGFESLYAPVKGSAYTKSYAEYSKTAHRTKLLFLIAASIVLAIIILALVTH